MSSPMTGSRFWRPRHPRETASTVTSKDGSRIAVTRSGSGPAVVFVDGALCYGSMGPGESLAWRLAPGCTVYRFDRRGRGCSTDSQPYSVQREIEDLDAVVDAAGGHAALWGMSSGALLALLYANANAGKVGKVSVYEAPCIVHGGHPPNERDWAEIALAVAQERRGAAVRAFLRSVGVPGFAVAAMSLLPLWSRLKAVAHTLPYDGWIVRPFQRGEPLDSSQFAGVTCPAQVVFGARSPVWMQTGNLALCNALPSAHSIALQGQSHHLRPAVLAPLLAEFFEAQAPAGSHANTARPSQK